MPAVLDSEIFKEYDGSDHCPLCLTVDIDKLGGAAPVKNMHFKIII